MMAAKFCHCGVCGGFFESMKAMRNHIDQAHRIGTGKTSIV
jgi:uncharacterized C2H2 Zn-finger protein